MAILPKRQSNPSSIVLVKKAQGGIGLVKLFGKAMLRMAEAAQDGDEHALELAAGAAHKALQGLIGD
jgi:hypothetical protein